MYTFKMVDFHLYGDCCCNVVFINESLTFSQKRKRKSISNLDFELFINFFFKEKKCVIKQNYTYTFMSIIAF
jgi:hypothetical protein